MASEGVIYLVKLKERETTEIGILDSFALFEIQILKVVIQRLFHIFLFNDLYKLV